MAEYAVSLEQAIPDFFQQGGEDKRALINTANSRPPDDFMREIDRENLSNLLLDSNQGVPDEHVHIIRLPFTDRYLEDPQSVAIEGYNLLADLTEMAQPGEPYLLHQVRDDRVIYTAGRVPDDPFVASRNEPGVSLRLAGSKATMHSTAHGQFPTLRERVWGNNDFFHVQPQLHTGFPLRGAPPYEQLRRIVDGRGILAIGERDIALHADMEPSRYEAFYIAVALALQFGDDAPIVHVDPTTQERAERELTTAFAFDLAGLRAPDSVSRLTPNEEGHFYTGASRDPVLTSLSREAQGAILRVADVEPEEVGGVISDRIVALADSDQIPADRAERAVASVDWLVDQLVQG